MPTSSQHTSQATHNLEFLESFYKDYKYNDWAITVGFYASIHIIENAIALKKVISYRGKQMPIQHSGELERVLMRDFPHLLPKNYSSNTLTPHVARNLIVKENFQEITDDFELLYRKSSKARYQNYLWDKKQVETFIKVYFTRIIDWSNKEFNTQFKYKF